MQILHVIPIARSLETEVLSYFSVKKVSNGSLVTVPLRKKKIKAIVVNSFSVTDLKSQVKGAGYQLRNISEIHDTQTFSPAFLATVEMIKNFYATTSGRVLNNVTPSILLKDLSELERNEDVRKSPSFQLRVLQRSLDERIDYYKTLFREKIFHDESLHIICPTREHCEFVFEHLKKNTEGQSFLFHGGMTKKKFYESYNSLNKLQKSSLVVSTANFIDVPQYHTSTLIIEQESSDYYRQIPKPFIDMRVFAEVYAQNAGYECILADGIVRPESWYKIEQGKAEAIEPFQKKVFKENEIHLIQQSQKISGKQSDTERYQELNRKSSFTTLSKETREYIKNGILQNEKIFLFVHKKSLAPTIVCQDCGNIARSPSSGYPFSLYTKKNKETNKAERIYICHMTGESIPAFDTCQFCKSWKMVPLGIGVERVMEEVVELFPDTAVLLMDGKHTPTKKKLKEVQDTFINETKSVILIGTSMAIDTLYHFDRSVIVSMDSYFARMSYSIHAQVLSLIHMLKEKTLHPVYIQSRNILSESLPVLRTGMYMDYVTQELQERKDYHYPPFVNLCVISKIVKKESMKREYKLLHQLFHSYDPQIMVRPGTKKGLLEIIVILQLDLNVWNLYNQDPKLQQLLQSCDRMTTIRINPKNILS